MLDLALHFPTFYNLGSPASAKYPSLSHPSATMHQSMTQDRIAELLPPFLGHSSLSSQQLGAIETYLELLLKWNSKLSLTAVRTPEEIITRHFGESLFAARQLFSTDTSKRTAIDIGSGAGFPGLPLKLWNQSLALTLIESNRRKATFLREVVRALHFESVTVLNERAESVSLQANVVTFRAVEYFDLILPIACKLAKPGGRVAILIGDAQVGLAQSTLPEVKWQAPILIPLSKNRSLLIGIP